MGADDVDLIVVSDAEEILGIGDRGVNGTDISIGKLAVYTAAAGIDPARAIAVNLDVGTDNEALLNDPAYLGNRHARVRGERYDALIKTYLQTASELFPNALLHFEDFGPSNARRILVENRDRYRIFNDDMQGTGAIVMAAAEAVASQVNPQDLGASLLPPVDNLRASSATVAVAKQAAKDGVAAKQPENWVQAVQDAMWQPVYR